jgi:hypothetical protein
MGWSLRWFRMSRYRRIDVGSGRRRSIVVHVVRLCKSAWFSLKLRFETFFKSAAEERVFVSSYYSYRVSKESRKIREPKPQLNFNELSHL